MSAGRMINCESRGISPFDHVTDFLTRVQAPPRAPSTSCCRLHGARRTERRLRRFSRRWSQDGYDATETRATSAKTPQREAMR
jgi:hypothetical protein